MIRIVKLTFREEKTNDFIQYFDTIKEDISNFSGCKGMRLLQDKSFPNIVYTYSEWESNEDLENYKNSELFQTVWPKVRTWFSEKAEASSTNVYFDGFELKEAMKSKCF